MMPALSLRRISIFFLSASLLAALYGLSRRDALESHHLERALQPGFDAFGRNCISLIPSAMAQTLISILPICALSLLMAFFLALIASMRNDRIRFWVRSSLDTVSALPGFLIAMALGVVFPASWVTSFLGAMLLVVPSITRFYESQILKMRAENHVVAAEAMGARPLHLWTHHFLPELFDSTASLLPFILLRLILIETSLSYLGLSTTPEHESWGRILAQGKDYLIEAPWILATSSIPLFLTLASFHLLSREEQN
jgi:peptide/nickel transport system permease protein